MRKRYHFLQLDVFTSQPFGGNQLAVFTDGRGLSSEEMQLLAREMNFSETTFVLPPELPEAAYKIRIFTPAVELPMAGHPTVGTAAALASLGKINVPAEGGEAVLELGIGAVPVIFEPVREPGTLPFVWMKHRKPEFSETPVTREAAAEALGLEIADIRSDLPLMVVSTGVPFLFVPLRSLDAAGRARSEAAALRRMFGNAQLVNVTIFTEEVVDPQARVHARMFAPHVVGIVEDPATGSMAAPMGAYLAKTGLLPEEPVSSFIIEQGLEMLRPSRMRVEVDRVGDDIEMLRIGGDSVLVGEGDIFWDGSKTGA